MSDSTGEEKKLAEMIRTTKPEDLPFAAEYEEYLNQADHEETTVETREGETIVHILKAKNIEKPCTVHINVHGGGFVIGHAERDIIFCSKLASLTGGIVVDIDYRLAPEHKFPCAFNEVYDVTAWVFKNIDSVGGDKNRVSIGGYSAGANLAAAVTLRAKQTKDFRLALQVLGYAVTDVITDPDDKPKIPGASFPAPERCRAFNRLYTGGERAKAESPFASISLATDEMLEGLPDTLAIIAGSDVLRPEFETYVSRLVHNGVTVTAKCFLDSVHGFAISCTGEWEDAQNMIIGAIKEAAVR